MINKTFNLFFVAIFLLALIAVNTLTVVTAQDGFNPVPVTPGNPGGSSKDPSGTSYPSYVANSNNDPTPSEENQPEDDGEADGSPSTQSFGGGGGAQGFTGWKCKNCNWVPPYCSWWQKWFCWTQYNKKCIVTYRTCHHCPKPICVRWWQ
ncbi:hypothetical protein G9A89_008484 [Geosiphon pyriformis]|nr:hypothetical protein G9A89_008484 [Geosiphon pyriformis]